MILGKIIFKIFNKWLFLFRIYKFTTNNTIRPYYIDSQIKSIYNC